MTSSNNTFMAIQNLIEWKETSSYENIRLKEKIKSELLSNSNIIHVLNNTDLDESTPEDYYNKNILPYYLLTPVQTDIKNYICYDTGFTEVPRYNDVLKYQQIIFYVLCSCKNNNIIDIDTDVARHDLLSALIIDQFNWENTFGFQVHLVSDQSKPVDNEFCARTLIFEQTVPDSIVKNGVISNMISNKKPLSSSNI